MLSRKSSDIRLFEGAVGKEDILFSLSVILCEAEDLAPTRGHGIAAVLTGPMCTRVDVG